MRLLGKKGVIVSPREGEQEEGSFSRCMIVVTGMNKHQQRDTVQIIVKKIIRGRSDLPRCRIRMLNLGTTVRT
jgi:hypothetical protein